jgi:hypothetical protein
LTIPPGVQSRIRRVSDVVRDMIPGIRQQQLTSEEASVAIYLRGNENLYNGLKGIVEARIAGRATVAEPSDPVACKSIIARDRELQWLLSRLEHIYSSPLSEAAIDDDSELPA